MGLPPCSTPLTGAPSPLLHGYFAARADRCSTAAAEHAACERVLQFYGALPIL